MSIQPYQQTHTAIYSPTIEKNLPVTRQFWISQAGAVVWILFSVWLSMPWLDRLINVVGIVPALLIIAGLAYIPGYLSVFTVLSLLQERPTPFVNENPTEPVTILIAALNEEKSIADTLKYVGQQDYTGRLRVILIDNGSTDATSRVAREAADQLGLDITILHEEKKGKHHALNTGLPHVRTSLFITLDADTILHTAAVRHLVSRLRSSPADVCAVAGSLLVDKRNSSFLAKLQEWEYFLSMASSKRMQSLYRSTLVAQGAFSLFRTNSVREVNGWPDSIGEDIVLTWKLFENNRRVCFEPSAVGFTEVPHNLRQFIRQRSRWARGMIEAIKQVRPWTLTQPMPKFFTSMDLLLPYMDVCYTLLWLPGLVFSCFGFYWIVGPNMLFVLPITFAIYVLLFIYQQRVCTKLNLHYKKKVFGLICYILIYQMILTPATVYGYVQELFHMRRVWK